MRYSKASDLVARSSRALGSKHLSPVGASERKLGAYAACRPVEPVCQPAAGHDDEPRGALFFGSVFEASEFSFVGASNSTQMSKTS